MNRIALVLILLFSSHILLACYCSKSSFIPEHYFRTTYIFKGKVIKVDECRVYFDIIKNYRGNLTNSDAYTDTHCDIICPIMATFEVGQIWVMWGNNRDEKTFYTHGCTRSSPSSKSYEIEQIDKLSNLNEYSKFYSKDSVLIAEGRTVNQNREGKWKIYDEYGFPKEFVSYKNNKPALIRIKFHTPLPIKSGNDLEHEKIKKGYTPDYIGKVSSIDQYDDNQELESSKTYDINGRVVSQELYKNGKEHGHHFAKHYSAQYKNGKRDGEYWIKHYNSEVIKTKGTFHNGVPIGEFMYYDEEGVLIYKSMNEYLKDHELRDRIENE